MRLEHKTYSEEYLEGINLRVHSKEGENVIYKDNIGNRYNFITVSDGLEFISLEKNKVKIFRGFHK